MNVRQRLQDEYASALVAHIANGDEAALNHAYELGRQILAEGCGVLDQVALHTEAFGRIVAVNAKGHVRQQLDRAGEFLAESLSPFEMSLRGYRDANARLAALHETLEQKIQERTRELIIANRVKDDFLAMVSHELRTPLTSINAVVAMLECGALGTMPADARKPIKLARRNCERLMRIVNDLLRSDQYRPGQLRSATAIRRAGTDSLAGGRKQASCSGSARDHLRGYRPRQRRSGCRRPAAPATNARRLAHERGEVLRR